MLMKWTRLLPYWLVMRLLRKDYGFNGYGTLKLNNNEYNICYYQVNGGEFVCYLQELQEQFDKLKQKQIDTKTDKKLNKLNKQLHKDRRLKKRLMEQFKYEDNE